MISVCLATYNGEKYLREQVASILPQLSEHDELVISDDGSTDRTIEILRSFHDSRLKLYNNDFRHGVAGNFENALYLSKGDIILVAGKGHENYQEVKGVKHHFDDKEVIREIFDLSNR